MALDTKKFLTRTASAAVFVVLLLGCTMYPVSLVVFFTLVGLIGLWEFYKLANRVGKAPFRPIGFLLHLLCVSAIFFLPDADISVLKPLVGILILAGPIYLLVQLFKARHTVFNVPGVPLSILYVTVPCVLIIIMSGAHKTLLGLSPTFTPQKILGMIFFIWINDTGAYLMGSFMGKHKMYERISPGKTWEGTIGGIVLAFASSFLMVKIFPQLELQHWMVIAVLVGVFGTLGDLVESMLKRLAGVKDSGNIMPGHGGVLDRFDSLLFVTPFVFAYLLMAGKI